MKVQRVLLCNSGRLRPCRQRCGCDRDSASGEDKRGERVCISLNVDVMWSDVPSNVKALSKTNDHISYVGEDHIVFCLSISFLIICSLFFVDTFRNRG